ncbi:MAG TPA: hypothetical protein VH877_30175 [Polyangia bacterium]|jgi:predicted aminopeptidase|nr:hypothetical protein [Polyangia bacterium]
MDGYRYWVERHKLLIELDRAKQAATGLPEAERLKQTMALEHDFRAKLDALYAEARDQFEKPAAKA